MANERPIYITPQPQPTYVSRFIDYAKSLVSMSAYKVPLVLPSELISGIMRPEDDVKGLFEKVREAPNSNFRFPEGSPYRTLTLSNPAPKSKLRSVLGARNK